MTREVVSAVVAAIVGATAAASALTTSPEDGTLARVEERLREVERAVVVLTCRLVPDECRR